MSHNRQILLEAHSYCKHNHISAINFLTKIYEAIEYDLHTLEDILGSTGKSFIKTTKQNSLRRILKRLLATQKPNRMLEGFCNLLGTLNSRRARN